MNESNVTNKRQEMYQKVSRFAIISFFSFLLTLAFVSFFLSKSQDNILNGVMFFGTSLLTLFLTVLMTVIFSQQGLFSKKTPVSEFVWYGIMMLFSFGSTILFVILGMNAI